jgi:hypothetical protein
MENELRENSTYCYFYLFRPNQVTPGDVVGFRRVISYMEATLRELKAVQGGKAHIPFIEANGQMVILICKMFVGDPVEESEFSAAKKQFIALWNLENKPYIPDKGLFLQKLDALYHYYKTEIL